MVQRELNTKKRKEGWGATIFAASDTAKEGHIEALLTELVSKEEQ